MSTPDRAYADVLPVAFLDYLVLEDGASRIMIFESQRVLALLQTSAYARALAEADTCPREEKVPAGVLGPLR